MKHDYVRVQLEATDLTSHGAASFKAASVADIRRALIAYPHFCVVSLPEPLNDKRTFITLASAVAGQEQHHETSDSPKKRLSFTNVRIDEANASAPRKTGTRYSRTNLPMAPHTDSSFRNQPHELVAFHCVTHDEIGGDSVLAAIEDVVQHLDPDLIRRLREPVFPFGATLRPVLSGAAGDDEIRYYRSQLERPLHDGTTDLSPEHLAAIDELDAVLEQSQLFHQLVLRAGEVLFMHNRKVLHGRKGFSGDSKRHFRRLRLRARVFDPLRVSAG